MKLCIQVISIRINLYIVALLLKTEKAVINDKFYIQLSETSFLESHNRRSIVSNRNCFFEQILILKC